MNLIEEKSLIAENNQENLHNKKPNNFWCKICDREFGNLTAFKKHNEIKHKSNRPLLCEECGKMFQEGSCMNEHERKNHIRKYGC